MQAADHMEFRRAFAHALFRALVDFLERERVRAGRIGVAAKSAQLAVRDADIRGIDVAIHVEEAGVAVQLFAHVIGEPAGGQQVRGTIQSDAVFGGQALAGENFVRDGLQLRVVDAKVGHGLRSDRLIACLPFPIY